eukprot:s2199_g5.t1
MTTLSGPFRASGITLRDTIAQHKVPHTGKYYTRSMVRIACHAFSLQEGHGRGKRPQFPACAENDELWQECLLQCGAKRGAETLGLVDFDAAMDLIKGMRKALPNYCAAKLIHWVRHGQGYHNLMAEACQQLGVNFSELGTYEEAKKATFHPYVNDAIKDPPLTCLGVDDAKALWPLAKTLTPELLVVSPLRRATETILIAFKDAVSNGVPVLAHGACREQIGVHTCDRRSSRTDYVEIFPKVDVSYVKHDEDPTSWTQRESKLELAQRAHDFLLWLLQRPETEIVVGTHSAFLMGLFHIALEISDDSMKQFFKTGELRSILVSPDEVARAAERPSAKKPRLS